MSNPVRKSGLFSTMVDGQAVVYDSATHETHCINPLAVKVWHLCDGQHDRHAIVRTLRAARDTGPSNPDADLPDLVDAALERFTDLGLIETASPLNRRALGAAAMKGLAAGLVVSVMVPTRAAAASVDCGSLGMMACMNTPGCSFNSGNGTCEPAG